MTHLPKNLFQKLVSGLYVPSYLKFSGGNPCCCGDDCPECMTVVISGMQNRGADTCGAFNRTYYLTRVGITAVWTCTFDVCWQTMDTIEFEILKRDGDWILKVTLGDDESSDYHVWEKNVGETEPDCSQLSSEVLSNVEDHGDCNSSSQPATATVTSGGAEECPCTELTAICQNCSDDLIPRTIQVEISGVVNDSPVDCGNCDDYNATYVIDCPDTPDPHVPCFWRLDFTPPSGCIYNLLTVAIDGPIYKVEVSLSDTLGNNTVDWSYPIPGVVKPDCLDFDELVIPLVFEFPTGICDFSSAIVTVTSL